MPATKVPNEKVTSAPAPHNEKILNDARKVVTKKSTDGSPTQPEAKIESVPQVPAAKIDSIYTHSKKKSE